MLGIQLRKYKMTDTTSKTEKILEAASALGTMAYDQMTIDNLKVAVAVAAVVPNPALPLARAITIGNVLLAMYDTGKAQKEANAKQD